LNFYAAMPSFGTYVVKYDVQLTRHKHKPESRKRPKQTIESEGGLVPV